MRAMVTVPLQERVPPMAPRLSIVIPCRCDAAALAATLEHLGALHDRGHVEVIVAASGEPVQTRAAVGGRATLLWPGESGRAALLNAGAGAAHAPILLFLHADSRPPLDALALIERALARADVLSGAFEHRFAERDWRLVLVCLINRIRYRLTRNYYGDQGQFVRADVFRRLGGFPDVPLMEDLELSQRLKRIGRTALIRVPLDTSGRRFLQRGPLRTLIQCGVLLGIRACGLDLGRYAEWWCGPRGQPPGSRPRARLRLVTRLVAARDAR